MARKGKSHAPPKKHLAGFSANLAYSVARNETFTSYLFGERTLFTDNWSGDGCCAHTETSSAGDRSGIVGRGLQGLVDTVLQISSRSSRPVPVSKTSG
jgi:hypothetical protein